MAEFQNPKDLVDNTKFWETEKKLAEESAYLIKKLGLIHPHDQFNMCSKKCVLKAKTEGNNEYEKVRARGATHKKKMHSNGKAASIEAKK